MLKNTNKNPTVATNGNQYKTINFPFRWRYPKSTIFYSNDQSNFNFYFSLIYKFWLIKN